MNLNNEGISLKNIVFYSTAFYGSSDISKLRMFLTILQKYALNKNVDVNDYYKKINWHQDENGFNVIYASTGKQNTYEKIITDIFDHLGIIARHIQAGNMPQSYLDKLMNEDENYDEDEIYNSMGFYKIKKCMFNKVQDYFTYFNQMEDYVGGEEDYLLIPYLSLHLNYKEQVNLLRKNINKNDVFVIHTMYLAILNEDVETVRLLGQSFIRNLENMESKSKKIVAKSFIEHLKRIKDMNAILNMITGFSKERDANSKEFYDFIKSYKELHVAILNNINKYNQDFFEEY